MYVFIYFNKFKASNAASIFKNKQIYLYSKKWYLTDINTHVKDAKSVVC